MLDMVGTYSNSSIKRGKDLNIVENEISTGGNDMLNETMMMYLYIFM